MPEKYAVGIDFGGTKILAGIVDKTSGKVISTAKKKTKQANDLQELYKRLFAVIDESISLAGLSANDITGIGIGAAGMVDRQKGVLLNAVNLGLQELALTEPLSQHYGLPAFLGNDVEVATLGEMRFGAGKGCNNFVCIFVGTGIGSGLVVDGKILKGVSGTAGEIGHTVLFPDGRSCGCGALGCLEAYASRTAIAKVIVNEVVRGSNSVLKDKIEQNKGVLRSKAISQALEQGDILVIRAITDAAKFMGLGLASLINLLNPKRIILGGGLVEAVDMYFQVANKEALQRCLPIAGSKTEIVKAYLGDFAGIIGASQLIK